VVLAVDEERNSLIQLERQLQSDASDAAGAKLASVHKRLSDIDAQGSAAAAAAAAAVAAGSISR
jgi:hypothetical protein